MNYVLCIMFGALVVAIIKPEVDFFPAVVSAVLCASLGILNGIRTWKKKIILSVFLLCLFAFPRTSQAQIPVIDAAAIEQLVVEIGHLVTQIGIMRDALALDRTQAIMGSALWDTTTEALLAEVTAFESEGEGINPILYGHDATERWDQTFPGHVAREEGEWLEAAKVRQTNVLITQRDLLHKLDMLTNAMAEDSAQIPDLEQLVDNCLGRNCLIKATSALEAKKLHQQQIAQQIQVTVGNIQAVKAGYELDEKMEQEEQERYFLTDGGKTPEKPEFKESGL